MNNKKLQELYTKLETSGVVKEEILKEFKEAIGVGKTTLNLEDTTTILDVLGCSQDWIEYKGKEMTLMDIGSVLTGAELPTQVYINYHKAEEGKTAGSVFDMLCDRFLDYGIVLSLKPTAKKK
jgi:hypothetical protein